MIIATTVVGAPLLLVAIVARRLRSDFEETAWRLMAVTMLLAPLASMLPKAGIGIRVPFAAPAPDRVSGGGTAIVAVAAYATVAALLLARIAIALIAAARLRRNAEPFDGAYLSASLRVPVTAGVIAPAILLPRDAATWPAETLDAVLAHERAHVTRRDPLWRLIARAAAAICWFHPLAWLASSAIDRLAEEAADREAVAAVGDRHAYADVLLEMLRTMTRSGRRVFGTAMIDRKAIAPRLGAILEASPRRRAPLAARTLLALLVAGGVLTMGAATYVAPAPPPTTVLKTDSFDREAFFRKRDELRWRFREGVRNTMRGIFRGFVR